MSEGINLSDIDAAEGAVKNVRVRLQLIGRELYKMREGDELGPQYGFDGYSRENYAGSNYSGQEGPDWGTPTPIISLRYYWPRAQDVIYVTMPQGWLESDWRSLEQARLDEERALQNAEEKAELERRAVQKVERDRRDFERLKRKFGEPQP